MKFCPICDVRLKKDTITSILTCPKCNYTEGGPKTEKQSIYQITNLLRYAYCINCNCLIPTKTICNLDSTTQKRTHIICNSEKPDSEKPSEFVRTSGRVNSSLTKFIGLDSNASEKQIERFDKNKKRKD
jgi:hypothetical protein